MRRAGIVRIVSAPKWRAPVLITAMVLLLVVAGIVGAVNPSRQTTILDFRGQQRTLLVAQTSQQLETGLGGRASLPLNEGMLFIFDTPAVQCFWMKDMHFPLDIIWLNASKEVIYIQPDVSPNTYPQSFCPPFPAQYVIELNNGQVRTLGLVVGNRLEF
jgi:uncharacterized membrane protein (UPF0127 family)